MVAGSASYNCKVTDTLSSNRKVARNTSGNGKVTVRLKGAKRLLEVPVVTGGLIEPMYSQAAARPIASTVTARLQALEAVASGLLKAL